VGHWVCDTVIGANNNGTIMTMVERKSGFSDIVKVSQNTSELVSRAII
jgi:IS30 family transposase